jgi:hypothetical protein
MANLPKERLQADDPPFTRIGIDFFGPFEVKLGRSVVKGYGVIFTCLNIRAIHLELAHSFDTDSCLNARRSIPRFETDEVAQTATDLLTSGSLLEMLKSLLLLDHVVSVSH